MSPPVCISVFYILYLYLYFANGNSSDYFVTACVYFFSLICTALPSSQTFFAILVVVLNIRLVGFGIFWARFQDLICIHATAQDNVKKKSQQGIANICKCALMLLGVFCIYVVFVTVYCILYLCFL